VSSKQDLLEKIKRLISEIGDIEEIKEVATEALNSKVVSPVDIINAMSEGLKIVGQKYEEGDYFLSELIMAGQLASELSNTLKPYLKDTKREAIGKVVIGTVKGDLHDIGKNIVIMMLSAAGFEVKDLGIDVSPERFVDAVKNEKPDILGMSALLTSTMDEMKKVIDKLKESGLRKNVKIMVGGRPVTQEFANRIGADAYAKDAIEAVKIAKKLVGIKEG